jgi:hypothetical protein
MGSDVLLLPNMIDNRKSTTKIKNRIFAIEAAPEATPPNPKMAAMMATIRKITVQRNIAENLNFEKLFRSNPFLENTVPFERAGILQSLNGMNLVIYNRHDCVPLIMLILSPLH